MKKVLGLVLVLVGLLGLLYLLMSYTNIQSPFSVDRGVQMTTAHIQEESDTYTIDVQYPQFGISSIDAQVRAAVEDVVAEFKTYPPNPPESATPKNEFTGTFDSVYVGPDVVSVELLLSEYTGGAHPITIFSGLNFDRASGKKLTLEDALKMIGKTTAQVSAESTAKLTAALGEVMFPEGANTNPENFSSFVISADEVTFIFQPYQVAPYSSGPQAVSFARIH